MQLCSSAIPGRTAVSRQGGVGPGGGRVGGGGKPNLGVRRVDDAERSLPGQVPLRLLGNVEARQLEGALSRDEQCSLKPDLGFANRSLPGVTRLADDRPESSPFGGEAAR